MKKYFLFILAVFLCLASSLRGQAPNVSDNGKIRCYTTEYEEQRRLNNPDLPSIEEFEGWMSREIQKRRVNPTKAAATRVIPTVIHVIYSNASENISDAQVFSQIDILNEDFARLNPDTVNTPAAFAPLGIDCNIEFCLAAIDPSGSPTNGINRVSMSGSPFSSGYVDGTIKPATSWDPDNYFNIWVCNLSGGLLGWAQFPEAAGLPGIGTGNGGADTDGIVLLHESVGRPPANPFPGPYNLGRTATHEAGHWLGLRHIWGDGGCTADDFCADTPESDAANYGCPTTHASCSTTDMVQNYMDYTEDDCMNIFTADQKNRMDVVLGGSVRRASLLTSSVCITSPVISFGSASRTVTENSSSGTIDCRGYEDLDIPLKIGAAPTGDAVVDLTVISGTVSPGLDYDILVGTVTFPDGVTGDQNFRIRIFNEGDLEATETLTLGFTISGATDATPGSVVNQVITLNDDEFDPSGGLTATIFGEDFETGGTGWTVDGILGINQWLISGSAGGMNGSASTYISRNGTTNTYSRSTASESRLISPMIDATGFTGMTLSFIWHCDGQNSGGSNQDYGSLSYSLDGTTFVNFVGDASSTPFVASDANVAYSTTLPALLEGTTFYLGFDWINNAGSGGQPPFGIDDIEITANSAIQVETVLSSMDEQYLGPFSTVYFYDTTSGDLLLEIENSTSWDYGCTGVTIDRAGTGASTYQDASMNFAVTDKSFLVTPTNNDPTGTYTVRLYFTEDEISGWEAATGQSRSLITIAKTGGAISNITPASPNANGPTNYFGMSPIIGTYAATDFFVEAEFNSGFSGFAAGVESLPLGNEPIPMENVRVTIAPNPFSNSPFTTISTPKSGSAHMNIYNLLGQRLANRKIRCSKGNNRFEFPEFNNITPGIYWVDVEMRGEHKRIKVVKR